MLETAGLSFKNTDGYAGYIVKIDRDSFTSLDEKIFDPLHDNVKIYFSYYVVDRQPSLFWFARHVVLGIEL